MRNSLTMMKMVSNDSFPAPRTPHQNGIAERNNQSMVEAARTMLIQGGVAKTF